MHASHRLGARTFPAVALHLELGWWQPVLEEVTWTSKTGFSDTDLALSTFYLGFVFGARGLTSCRIEEDCNVVEERHGHGLKLKSGSSQVFICWYFIGCSAFYIAARGLLSGSVEAPRGFSRASGGPADFPLAPAVVLVGYAGRCVEWHRFSWGVTACPSQPNDQSSVAIASFL